MMKMNLAATLCALALGLSAAAPPALRAAGMIDLVPAVSPVVILAKNLPAMAEKLQSFAGHSPEKGGAESLFALLGIAAVPEGIDMGGEVLVAMPQFPFPLIAVTVGDYDLFIRSLAELQGPDTPPPPALMEGVDIVIVAGKPLFARREGSYALLSPMPMLLNPPAPGSGLQAQLSPVERELLSGSGLFLRFDMGMILTMADPFLRQGLSRLGESASGDGGEQDVVKLLEAEYALLLRGFRQVRAVTVGAAARDDALTVSSLYIPQPGTPFASLLGNLEPGKPAFLSLFDGDAAMAGTFRFDGEAMGDLIRSMTDFMFDSGIYNLEPGDRAAWDRLVEESLAAAGTNSAYAIGPSGSGALSALMVSEVRDSDKFRSLLKDSLTLAEKLLSSPVYGDAMELEFTEAFRKHGDIEIDRYRMTMEPPAGSEGERFREGMDALFGGDEINVWTAFFDGYLVASYYTATPDDLIGLIDRMRNSEKGDLLGSESFIDATRGLPGESTSLSFFSLPRFLSLFAGMMTSLDPGRPPPPEFPNSSGIGISYLSTGDAMRVDARIPGREIRNMGEISDYFRSLEGADTAPPAGGPATF